MKNYLKIYIFAFVITKLAACSSADHANMTQAELNITYPAVYVINGENSSISVINLATNNVTETIKLGEGGAAHSNKDMIMFPHHITLSADAMNLAIGVPGVDLSAGHTSGAAHTGMQGKIVVVDATKGTIKHNVTTPLMNHNAIYSPDGKEIWTTQIDNSGKCLVYDATTLTLKNTIIVGIQPAEITISQDKQYAFVANGGSNSVTVIKIADKTVVKTIVVGEDPVGAWTGSDNKMYVDNEKGKTISIIDVATLAVVETINLGFTPGYATYNAVLNELWVSNAGSNKVIYFQRMNNAWMKMGEILTGADAHAITFTKDGQTAYITNQGAASVSVINAATKTKIKDIAVGTKPNGIVIKQ